MRPTIDSQSARDELFKRIGRNVVNFQYLEATLRILIPVLSNKGTLKELQANKDEMSRKHKKSTLRRLATAYHKSVYGDSVMDEALPDEALSEIRFAFSVHIGLTPDKVAQRKRALKKLIDERNRLIHHDLLNIDLKSRKQCEKLSERLDKQYIRIRRQLESLHSLQTRFGEMTVELGRLLESGEFLALLRGEGEDANPSTESGSVSD